MSNLVVHEFSNDQMSLIKATVAKNATNDELNLFLYRCKKMGLDPLKPGHIHFVKYGNNPGTIIIGIDGFRSKAASTGKHTGTKRGVLRNEAGLCIGAWCEVFKSDWAQCAREEVSLAEYNTGKNNWAKMPETMIKKVAEVAALRMAFPDELGGVYSDDEMDQATITDIKDVTQSPVEKMVTTVKKEISENDPGNYVCSFGKYKGQMIKDLDPYELNSYCSYIKEQAEQSGKAIQGKVKEFLDTAEMYLSKMEVDTPLNDEDFPL